VGYWALASGDLDQARDLLGAALKLVDDVKTESAAGNSVDRDWRPIGGRHVDAWTIPLVFYNAAVLAEREGRREFALGYLRQSLESVGGSACYRITRGLRVDPARR